MHLERMLKTYIFMVVKSVGKRPIQLYSNDLLEYVYVYFYTMLFLSL